EQRYKKKLENIVSAFKGNRKDKVKFAQHLDLTGFLAHNLMVSDKASMRASIELRVPFLDEAIVAHGVLLPSEKLVKKFQLKQPLKALLSILLPKHLVKRPKTGFNPPLDGLIEKIGSARLKKEFLNLESFVNVDVANTLVDQHFEGKANNTYKLWQLLYFSRWLIVGFHGKGNPSGGLP
ncbi:MAG: asparagine synthase-related protein, partial [Legionellaceae bacterium]|nr:asparagine synthase-related protein [Legionellaceae bacterium]